MGINFDLDVTPFQINAETVTVIDPLRPGETFVVPDCERTEQGTGSVNVFAGVMEKGTVVWCLPKVALDKSGAGAPANRWVLTDAAGGRFTVTGHDYSDLLKFYRVFTTQIPDKTK